MSKPVKEMIIADYQRRFGDLEGALIVDVRGVDGNENNEMRLDLQQKQICVTVVKNSLVRKAIRETRLEQLDPLFEGPCALAHGGETVVDVARELVAWARKVSDLSLKGAVFDGEFFEGEEGVKRLSQYPTREEAQAKVVSLVLAPAGNVVRAATSPGSNILGIIKEMQERLERGETIARAG